MNSQEYKDCQKHHNAILYKVISKCNDSCPFCLEYKFIKSNRPPLALQEFKRNYLYFKKRFNIDYVILTGGEPTLHPEFFKMIEFIKNKGVGFRFITNLIKFNDHNFLEKLRPCFTDFKNDLQRQQTKIIASINDPSSHSLLARERIRGLKNALEYKFPLMVTIVVYRGNIKKLTELVLELEDIISRVSPRRKYHIEFRPMYVEGTEEFLLKESLPKNFNELMGQIEKLISLVQGKNLIVTFWNLPLCYLKNYRRVENNTVKDRQSRRLIKVSKDAQLDKVEVRNWENFLKSYRECRECQLRFKCSGIDKAYIEKYGYPMPKQIFSY
jgi:MoaA/NifB/PqqE/SkfB family radical SAM enzyme